MKWRTDAWLLINSNVFSLSSFSCVLLTFYSVIKQKKDFKIQEWIVVEHSRAASVSRCHFSP